MKTVFKVAMEILMLYKNQTQRKKELKNNKKKND